MYRTLLVALIVCASSLGAADIDGQGFILRWMILGPYDQGGAATPGEAAMREDYLTDGSTTEENVAPFPGLIVDTNYGIAASTGLRETPNGNLNPTGKPEWIEYQSPGDTIDFEVPQLYAAGLDGLMTYACVFVENLTGAALPNVRIGAASDDAIQILLNEDEVWINNTARGFGGAGQVQDWTPRFTLPDGVSRLLVKVFEGGGETGFRLKFEDGSGNALLSNRLGISLEPFGPCPASVDTVAEPFLREVTFFWDARFSHVEIKEDGATMAETSDTTVRSLTLADVAPGEHRYAFVTRMGADDAPCDAIDRLVTMTPAWPEDFACTFAAGTIEFTWRNREGYYDVLKIQEGGGDVPGVLYDLESAQMTGLPAGTYSFELVAELAGSASSGIVCSVDVTGPPPAFLRGDANGDGSVNVADVSFLLMSLFGGGDAPDCLDAGDVNDDGRIDVSDPVGALRYLFADGVVPAPGATVCDLDPTADALVRCVYTACN